MKTGTKSQPFSIVKYEDKYRNQLLEVWERSVSASHYFLTPSDFEGIKAIVWTIDFNALAVYCLLNDNAVIGFIGVMNRKVEMLFIDPKFFGLGCGKLLMNHAFSQLGINAVDVNEQNSGAVRFYQSLGFEIYERTEKDDQGRSYPLLRMKLIKDPASSLL